MSIESELLTYYLMAIVVFVLSATIYEILHSQYMHGFDLELWNGQMSNVNISFDRQYQTFYLIAIVMFAYL